MNNAVKIVIRVDATKDVAIGHLKRCISLAQMFAEKNIPVAFITAFDDYTKEILKNYGFKHITIDGSTNSRQDCRQTIETAKSLAAEIIIVDSYKIDNDYRKKIMENGFFTVSISDTGYMDLLCDCIINGNLNAEKSKNAAAAETVVFSGIKYLILAKDYRNEANVYPHPDTVKNILITMGGIDHYDLTTKILAILEKYKEDFDITAIVGPYYDNIVSIKAQIKKMSKKVNLVNSAPTLYPYIKKSSLAFSAGGQTLYELSALGRPTIGLLLWKNQEGNVKELAQTGAILSVMYSEDEKFEISLRESATKLITDKNLRNSLSAKASAQVDGKGAERAVNMILNTYQKWITSKERNVYG